MTLSTSLQFAIPVTFHLSLLHSFKLYQPFALLSSGHYSSLHTLQSYTASPDEDGKMYLKDPERWDFFNPRVIILFIHKRKKNVSLRTVGALASLYSQKLTTLQCATSIYSLFHRSIKKCIDK